VRFNFDEQVEAQPQALQAVLDKPAPPRLDPSRPLIFAGQGTSLHAARIAARWAGFPAQAFDAHELALSLEIPRGAQVVAISHGGRGFIGLLLAKAREAEAETFAIAGEGAPELRATHVLRTCPSERAQTHSVSYLTALAVLARLLGRDARQVPRLVREAIEAAAPEAAVLKDRNPVLVAGFGQDSISASELALKLKEACFVWAEGLSVEQALHGPHFALAASMGAVIYGTENDGGRTNELREKCRQAGMATLLLPSPECDETERPFVQAVKAQRLAAELARLTFGNPDTAKRTGA
jgi:glucosamine--fructose-6-phosphate aminotransferase (isomerizing)